MMYPVGTLFCVSSMIYYSPSSASSERLLFTNIVVPKCNDLPRALPGLPLVSPTYSSSPVHPDSMSEPAITPLALQIIPLTFPGLPTISKIELKKVRLPLQLYRHSTPCPTLSWPSPDPLQLQGHPRPYPGLLGCRKPVLAIPRPPNNSRVIPDLNPLSLVLMPPRKWS